MLPKASDSESEDESDQDSGGDSDEAPEKTKGKKTAKGGSAAGPKNKTSKMGGQSSQVIGNGQK